MIANQNIDISGLSEPEAYERIADNVREAFLSALKEKRTPLHFRCDVDLLLNQQDVKQWGTVIVNYRARGFLEEKTVAERAPNANGRIR